MPAIADDVFLGNAKFYYQTGVVAVADAAAGTYIKVHNVTDVGEMGLTSEAKDKTNMEDTSKRYGAGQQDAPDKELKGNIIPFQGVDGSYLDEYGIQQTFFQACRDLETMAIKVEYADGETDEFLFKPLGYKTAAPSSSEWRSFSVPGKQNSGVTTTAATV